MLNSCAGLACAPAQQLLQLAADLAALLPQQLAIDQHAAVLHAQQHRHQRLLELLVQALQLRHALICGHSV